MTRDLFKIFPFCLLFLFNCTSQSLPEVELSQDWINRIQTLAPQTPTVSTDKRKIMVFSQATGFTHWCIPHNNEMLKILGKKSGTYDVKISRDADSFESDNLDKYDAIVFNNCNPSSPDRDLFYDLLKQNTNLDEETIRSKADELQQNVLDYVKNGGGLLVLHGAISVQNNSPEFSEMVGGSFDFHPIQQEIHVREVDHDHPLVSAFSGDGFTHKDEPYFFNNAYAKKNFHPLLYFEVSKIRKIKKPVRDKVIYVSWIKPYGEGRVFYTSPSHNAQTLENPEFLKFLLDGIQYVTGDLKCDDSPMKKVPR